MKTLIETRPIRIKTLVLGTFIFSAPYLQNVMANDDQLLRDSEQIFNSDQIDIDGQFRKKPTASERLAKIRKNVEQKHEQMVQKKIEDIRMNEELKLGNKLQKAFNGNFQNEDSLGVQQAAVQKPKIIAPPVYPVKAKKSKDNRIVPSVGLMNFDGDKADFESNFHGSLAFESKIHTNILLGVSVAYTTLDIQDVRDNFNGFGVNQFFFGGFNNGFGQYERDMEYRQFDLTLTSKFYLLRSAKIKPYLGVGLGYRKASLEYSESDPGLQNGQFSNGPFFNNQNFSSDDAEYSTGYMTGQANIGADVDFNDSIGARLDLSYTKGLTDGSSSSNNRRIQNGFLTAEQIDQISLDREGRKIEDASIVGISAGLLIKF